MRAWTLALLLAAAVCGRAEAGALSIMPTRVDFAEGRAVQSLLVTNLSGETVTVEVQVATWPEDAPGQQANDVVVTPAVVTLPPNQRTRVRVGLLRRAGGEAERSYRIYFTELPAPAATNGGAIGVRLRVGVPVFVAPDQRRVEALRWTARESPEGWALEAANPGNVHVRLARLSLASAGREQPLQPATPYVLAGSLLRVPLAARPVEGARIRWLEGSDEHEAAVAPP